MVFLLFFKRRTKNTHILRSQRVNIFYKNVFRNILHKFPEHTIYFKRRLYSFLCLFAIQNVHLGGNLKISIFKFWGGPNTTQTYGLFSKISQNHLQITFLLYASSQKIGPYKLTHSNIYIPQHILQKCFPYHFT